MAKSSKAPQISAETKGAARLILHNNTSKSNTDASRYPLFFK